MEDFSALPLSYLAIDIWWQGLDSNQRPLRYERDNPFRATRYYFYSLSFSNSFSLKSVQTTVGCTH
jgi:hypothetical protein